MRKPNLPLPELRGQHLIRAARTWDRLAGRIKQSFSPQWPVGRDERFRRGLERVVHRSALGREVEEFGGVAVAVSVDEAFGKPVLVSVDLRVSEEQIKQMANRWRVDPKDQKLRETYRLLAADLLERVVERCWDNPEIAPVGVRGRVVILRGDPQQPPPDGREGDRSRLVLVEGEKVLLDMTSLGFRDEIARPRDLYLRYGPALSDPKWRP